MANRPVFIPSPETGLVEERSVEFEFFSGFAEVQKQRSIASLHEAATEAPDVRLLLEVSTKSTERLGGELSAFNLTIDVNGEPDPVPVEHAYQGSKVFPGMGPFPELFRYPGGREVKRFIKDLGNPPPTGFEFLGEEWGLTPRTAFYDWLYLKGLQRLAVDDYDLDAKLANFDAFTDIEFNPRRSVNCQARSCALYVALSQKNILGDALGDKRSFVEVLTDNGYGVEPDQGQLW